MKIENFQKKRKFMNFIEKIIKFMNFYFSKRKVSVKNKRFMNFFYSCFSAANKNKSALLKVNRTTVKD